MSITNTYDRSFQGLVRTRAYVKGLGGQLMSRPLQRIMLPGTYDLGYPEFHSRSIVTVTAQA